MGRAARWFLILTEYELQCISPKAIKSQALADLLANFPSGHFEPSLDELPADSLESCHTEEEWVLEFDGSSITKGGGAGIILLGGNERIGLSYKLDFPCSNNEAEYEALILGLLEALNRGVRYLCIKGDSNLVIKQSEGDFALKHIHLAPYRVLVQRLCKQFTQVLFEKLTRTENRHTNALATIATKITIPEGQDSTTLTVLRRTTPISITHLMPREDKNDWRT